MSGGPPSESIASFADRMTWNPQQYLKFEQPRLRPAIDLLARIDADSPHLIYDLGCGTGHITRLLAMRWPDARIVGVDGSAEMLAERFLDALDEPQRGEFEREYARRVGAAYPPLENGQTLFPFRRLFIVLQKR